MLCESFGFTNLCPNTARFMSFLINSYVLELRPERNMPNLAALNLLPISSAKSKAHYKNWKKVYIGWTC